MSKQKVLIHSLVFSPDGVSTAYLYNDIALKFKENGYTVVVLTTTPHYNLVPGSLHKQPLKKRWFGLYRESDFHGIKVIHVPQRKFKLAALRMLGFIYWHILSFFLGLFERNINLILSPSPPLTIGFVNLILAKLKGAKVIYNVQEIYPDFLIEQGGLKNKAIISMLKWLERYVYKHSDAVTTIDRVFYHTLVNRFADQSKLHIIPNFVDTDLYRPLEDTELEIDRQLFPNRPGTLKLMYAGNIGHAQDWEPLLAAAMELKAENIEFFIIGEGVMKDYIQQQIQRHGLTKVHLIPYQAREQMPGLIAYADLQFIFMSKDMENHGFPSKVYTIMACKKPLLVCSGVSTPIYQFLKDLNCSYLIAEADLNAKTERIVDALKGIEKAELFLKGQEGLKVITSTYAKSVVTQQYVDLAHKLIKDG